MNQFIRGTVLNCVLIVQAPLLADESRPGPAKPSGPELVAAIVKEENKVHELRSLYLRFEDKGTNSPEGIARRLVKLKKLHAGAEIDVERESSLWPEHTGEIELAFDEKRVRHMQYSHRSDRTLTTWDGQRGVLHQESLLNNWGRYTLYRSPAFSLFFNDLCWLRVGAHSFWFDRYKVSPEKQARANGLPKDYTIVGEADFHGRRCHVLENVIAKRRLHVDVNDGRLRGLTQLKLLDAADYLPAVNRAAGCNFKDSADSEHWYEGLTSGEQKQYNERLQVELFRVMRPWYEYVLDDYRELAPGFWIPATQEFAGFEADGKKSLNMFRRELRLVEARVNEPLADELFTVKLEDGVEVFDSTYEPQLVYTQKADRTSAEWQKILADYRQRAEAYKKQEAARDALVGQPAPEFPKSTWLNSQPLDLDSLKGKVVLLEFWATSCGPCRGAVQVAQEWHKGAKGSPLVVIGVHDAGIEAKEIEKFAKEAELTYPILIDVPRPEGLGGLLAGQLMIDGIPDAIVIDQQGRIAAHGQLHEVSAKIRELLSRAK